MKKTCLLLGFLFLSSCAGQDGVDRDRHSNDYHNYHNDERRDGDYNRNNNYRNNNKKREW